MDARNFKYITIEIPTLRCHYKSSNTTSRVRILGRFIMESTFRHLGPLQTFTHIRREQFHKTVLFIHLTLFLVMIRNSIIHPILKQQRKLGKEAQNKDISINQYNMWKIFPHSQTQPNVMGIMRPSSCLPCAIISLKAKSANSTLFQPNFCPV